MSDEQRSEQSEQSTDEDKPSPQERLEEVGAGTGTYDIPPPGEGGERESGTAGLPDEEDVPDETIEEIDSDRAERLDPDNRPDGAEVDNTPRTFDAGAGMFTDNPDYDPNNRPYAGPDDSGPPEERPSGESGDSSDEAGDQQDDRQGDQQDDRQDERATAAES